MHLKDFNHIYSFSESVNANILQVTWNTHDGEHFAGTHYDTMLTKDLKIENLTQDENKLSWQLFLYKREDRAAKRNKMSPFVNDVMIQCFNTFLPSLFILTNEIAKGKLFVAVGYVYPESPTKTNFCLDGYFNFEYTWWHKLLKFPQKGNNFRDCLLSEDMSILNNLGSTFDQKILLKNDTPAKLAIDYLQNWV